MNKKLELLAPAGSMEALKAAFANGADAAYLGASAFGARASVGFDPESLKAAVELAHFYGKKIYVTVNILVRPCELQSVRETFRFLSDLGVDAVLLQDLGLLKMCREEFPQLTIHASTQMALHHATGASLLRDLGASRVVLARECDLTAIQQAAQTGMEVEVFCHGALCVSVSGQCLFSSMIGGRSGNRGRCAQPCRLPYTYLGQTGAWLSPRDICTRNILPQMVEAGACSFKIEGRLKRAEYVAIVTRIYRNALDQIAEGKFQKASSEEMESLVQIFSRGGFSAGYPGQCQDAAIIDPTRVMPQGILMGKTAASVKKGNIYLADIKVQKTLNPEDGLEVGNQQIRYSGPLVPAGQTATLRLRETADIHTAVYRTENQAQLSAAAATYTPEALEKVLAVPFDAQLVAYPGKPIQLTVNDGTSSATVQGEICADAQNKALNEESAVRALSKTSGTGFILRKLSLKSQNAFVPVASLNRIRRDALEKLKIQRIAANQHISSAPVVQFSCKNTSVIPAPRIWARTNHLKEAPALLDAGAEKILYAPLDYREDSLRRSFSCWPENTFFVLPSQCREETLHMFQHLCDAYQIPVCPASPGQLKAFHNASVCTEGVPVMNQMTVQLLETMGYHTVTLSRELSQEDIAQFPMNGVEKLLPVYGRTRLMLLNHCPMRTTKGLDHDRVHCERCKNGQGAAGTCLTDRMDAHYPLQPIHLPEGCLVELLAPLPTQLSGIIKPTKGISWLVTFTDEELELRLQIVRHFARLLQGETTPLPIRGTVGRFRDGVQ